MHSAESRGPTPELKPLPDAESPCTIQKLFDVIDSNSIVQEDMDFILDRTGAFLSEDRGRAEQVVDTAKFRHWLVHRGASMLLVHGDYDIADYPEISPLSTLCVTLMQALQTQPGFVSLAFFCGRHLSQQGIRNPGASDMMRSFIEQLLRQCPSACPDTLGSEISLDEIEKGNLDHLIRLFTALIHRLPTSMTLMMFIDGVYLYERRKYCEELYEVIDMLVKMVESEESMQSTVKILLTSQQETRTRELNGAFRSRNAILSMRSMHDTGHGPSRSGGANRIAKEISNASESIDEE